MKKHGLLLERHTGRRRPREHDGRLATIRTENHREAAKAFVEKLAPVFVGRWAAAPRLYRG